MNTGIIPIQTKGGTPQHEYHLPTLARVGGPGDGPRGLHRIAGRLRGKPAAEGMQSNLLANVRGVATVRFITPVGGMLAALFLFGFYSIATVHIWHTWCGIADVLWCLAWGARFRHHLLPILERLMSEPKNIVVMPQLSAEQIERLLWRLNHRKYPKHLEVAEKRVAELRRERRAA